MQCKALRQQLDALNLPHDCLWVTSPLTRAIETFMHGCPHWPPPNFYVRPEISEKLVTSGDIGRPPHMLKQSFSALQDKLDHLDEVWWYNKEGKPNCSINRMFSSKETDASLKKRIGEFRSWLLSRPEKVIVAVGHSVYWKAFCTTQNGLQERSLANCEVKKLLI